MSAPVETAGDALGRLEDSLNATNVLSEAYKRHILAWAYKAVELADKATARQSVPPPLPAWAYKALQSASPPLTSPARLARERDWCDECKDVPAGQRWLCRNRPHPPLDMDGSDA